MKLNILPKAGGCVELEMDPHDLVLEAPCPGSVGNGGCRLGRNRSGGVCSVCDGTGAIITPIGMHILAFVIRQAPQFRALQKAAQKEILPTIPKLDHGK